MAIVIYSPKAFADDLSRVIGASRLGRTVRASAFLPRATATTRSAW